MLFRILLYGTLGIAGLRYPPTTEQRDLKERVGELALRKGLRRWKHLAESALATRVHVARATCLLLPAAIAAGPAITPGTTVLSFAVLLRH